MVENALRVEYYVVLQNDRLPAGHLGDVVDVFAFVLRPHLQFYFVAGFEIVDDTLACPVRGDYDSAIGNLHVASVKHRCGNNAQRRGAADDCLIAINRFYQHFCAEFVSSGACPLQVGV